MRPVGTVKSNVEQTMVHLPISLAGKHLIRSNYKAALSYCNVIYSSRIIPESVFGHPLEEQIDRTYPLRQNSCSLDSYLFSRAGARRWQGDEEF